MSIASGIAQHHHQEVTNAHYVNEHGHLKLVPAPTDKSEHQYVKPLLRLDAWLGEWLAEDYYIDITPPPPTPLLVGSAKADYIRPSSGIQSHMTQHNASPLYNMSSMAASLPAAFTGGFVAPSPTWRVSPNGQIPRGYFSHAKEYAEFDIGWDSTKLGGGGEYREEWTSMHKRFKNGWNRLLWYYATEDQHVATSATQWKRCGASSFGAGVKNDSSDSIVTVKEISAAPQTLTPINGNPTPPLSDCGEPDERDINGEEEDEEIETVLVLVTHGAGCNALIGAITHQPVLIDIGIASVTMAVRRDLEPELPSFPHYNHSHSAPVVGDIPASPPVKYTLQIVANNEHIRSGGTPTSTPPVSPHLRSLNKNRYGAGSSLTTIGSFTLNGSGIGNGNGISMFGNNSVKRSASSASTGPAPKGLWSRPLDGDSRPTSRDEGLSNSGLFGSSSMLFGSAIKDDGSDDEGSSTSGSIAEAPVSAGGLWGGSGVVRGSGLWADQGGWERKRRWTASTRNEFPG